MRHKKFKLSAVLLLGFGLMGMHGQTSGTFIDSRDSAVYKTVTIGNQIWMAENLKYLPSVMDSSAISKTMHYYYVYGYDGTNVADAKATSNYSTYGVLYNWTAAMNGAKSRPTNPSGVQGVCPTGWHLPSDSEWTELTDYLGGANVLGAGGKLKETGIAHWNNPNTGATNETSFTALSGGKRQSDGTFSELGVEGYWWSATQQLADYAYFRFMSYNHNNVNEGYFNKALGFSVRCVKN